MNSPTRHLVEWAFNGCGLVVLALVEDINDGAPATQADISTIAFKVRDQQGTLIDSASLTVSAVIFNTLQDSDLRWSDGSTGYNFRHVCPGTSIPDANKIYVASYKFTPTSGEPYGFSVITPTKPLEYFSA